MNPADPPITVTVHANGQVFVNDTLAAEVVVGPYDAPGTKTVHTRDDLAHQLNLHRIADVVAEHLTELIAYLERDGRNGQMFVATKERGDFGAAFVAGLLGEPGELTGRQVYRAGHRAGTTFRALHGHLVDELDRHARIGPTATPEPR